MLLLWGFATSLAVHLLWSWIFSLGFYLPSQLSSSVLSLPSLDSIPLLVYAHCFLLLFSLAVILLSFFSFSFVFIGIAYGVSSLAFFNLTPFVAWFSSSLSFLFSRLAYAPSFLVLPVLSELCFLPTVLFLQCFPDFVRCFLFLCVLLVIVSLVFSCFVSVFLCFRLFMVRLSCVFLTSLGAFPVFFEFRISSLTSASFSYSSFLLSILVFSPAPPAFIRYSGVRFCSWSC